MCADLVVQSDISIPPIHMLMDITGTDPNKGSPPHSTDSLMHMLQGTFATGGISVTELNFQERQFGSYKY